MLIRNFFAFPLVLLLIMPPAAGADSLWDDLAEIPEPARVAGNSISEEDTAAEKDFFKGSVELGYLASSGNSETTSLNGKLVMEYEVTDWRNGFMAQVIRATDQDELTAERYQATAKSDYKFTEHDYFFAVVNYDRDEFSGFTRRTSEAVGYGRRLVQTDAHRLDVEIGAGARQTDFTDGTEESGTIGRLSANYKWSITETSAFSQTAAVESGSTNTYSESVTSITANIMSRLALKVSYTIKRNSDVPIGVENTDTYTAVSLLYSF